MFDKLSTNGYFNISMFLFVVKNHATKNKACVPICVYIR